LVFGIKTLDLRFKIKDLKLNLNSLCALSCSFTLCALRFALEIILIVDFTFYFLDFRFKI